MEEPSRTSHERTSMSVSTVKGWIEKCLLTDQLKLELYSLSLAYMCNFANSDILSGVICRLVLLLFPCDAR